MIVAILWDRSLFNKACAVSVCFGRNRKRASCWSDREFDRRRRRPLAGQLARNSAHPLPTGCPLPDADSRLQHSVVSTFCHFN